MRITLLFASHRRLLAVGLASLLFHCAVITSLAGLKLAPTALMVDAGALSLRLVAPTPAASPAPVRLAPATARAPQERPRSAAAPVPAPALAPSLATTAGSAPAVAAQEPELVMPGTYRVRQMPPARVQFDVMRSESGGAAVSYGKTDLRWQISDNKYTLQIDSGIDAPSGYVAVESLRSDGEMTDFGVGPRSASETRAGITTRMNVDALGRHMDFPDSGRSAQYGLGGQDRASMLIQLAGMGNANPGQISGEIRFWVGARGGAGIVRFTVLGEEQVASPMGQLSAWHLYQEVAPGEARLEVWLAPAHQWLPVQMRTTEPDGVVTTQLVARIELAAAQPP
jgi:Protein of unknown function (DUF3108)